MNPRDGYEEFFSFCSKETFFNFGIQSIIKIVDSDIKKDWNQLKNDIRTRSDNIFIRDFGRNGSGNKYLSMLYKDIFNIKINFDPTNNTKPSQKLQKYTGYRKNKTIFNYQVSHVFGNTKNVYCFTAPWNIVFIPKILDPFTGHEAKGIYVNEFKQLFNNTVYDVFEEYITDYNSIILEIKPEIEKWVETSIDDEKMKFSIKKEFTQINKI